MRQTSTFLVAALLLVPTAALAHVGSGAVHGFGHGFAHPLGGLDHVLAMVAVGLFAAQLGGRALWLAPAAFVLAMAMGGGASLMGFPFPYVEVGIALSVLVLGAVIALGTRAPIAIAVAMVGFFATFHGYAHATEMPQEALGVAYGLGFLTATALLHVAGIGLGLSVGCIGQRAGALATRVAGCVIAAAGLGLLAGIV